MVASGVVAYVRGAASLSRIAPLSDATALEAVRVIKAFVEDSVVLNAVVP